MQPARPKPELLAGPPVAPEVRQFVEQARQIGDDMGFMGDEEESE